MPGDHHTDVERRDAIQSISRRIQGNALVGQHKAEAVLPQGVAGNQQPRRFTVEDSVRPCRARVRRWLLHESPPQQ